MQNMDVLDAQVIETSANKPEPTEDPTSNDFVAKEKYSKLKHRFKALREEYIKTLASWEQSNSKVNQLAQERKFLRSKIECFLQSSSFKHTVSDEDLTTMLIAQSSQQVSWQRQQHLQQIQQQQHQQIQQQKQAQLLHQQQTQLSKQQSQLQQQLSNQFMQSQGQTKYDQTLKPSQQMPSFQKIQKIRDHSQKHVPTQSEMTTLKGSIHQAEDKQLTENDDKDHGYIDVFGESINLIDLRQQNQEQDEVQFDMDNSNKLSREQLATLQNQNLMEIMATNQKIQAGPYKRQKSCLDQGKKPQHLAVKISPDGQTISFHPEEVSAKRLQSEQDKHYSNGLKPAKQKKKAEKAMQLQMRLQEEQLREQLLQQQLFAIQQHNHEHSADQTISHQQDTNGNYMPITSHFNALQAQQTHSDAFSTTIEISPQVQGQSNYRQDIKPEQRYRNQFAAPQSNDQNYIHIQNGIMGDVILQNHNSELHNGFKQSYKN